MREAFVFVVFTGILIAVLMSSGDATSARLDVATTTALHVAGGVIAGAMTFALAIATLTGVTGRRQVRLLLPLLAGLALAGWQWSATVALAIVGVGIAIGERFYQPSEHEQAANESDEAS